MSNPKVSSVVNFIQKSVNLICITDKNYKYIATSDSWGNLFSSGDSLHLISDFPEIKGSISLAFDSILNGEYEKRIEHLFMCQNGTKNQIILKIRPHFDEDGIAAFIVSVEEKKDVAEIFQLETMLAKKFNDTFYYSVIGMALVSPSGKWIEVNDKLVQMLGYDKDELLSLTFQDITHPDDLEKDLILFGQLLNNEIEFYQIEKRYYHKKGNIISVNLSVSIVMDTCGKPTGVVAQIENTTMIKKAQETIRENEYIFKSIFHSTYQFTALLTKDGRIREINNSGLDFIGFTQKEAIGKEIWEIPNWKLSKELGIKLKKNIERAAAGEFINYEELLWDSKQNEVIIDFTLKPFFNEKQEVVSVIAEGMYIQEIIDARNKLLESEQKLRAFFNLSPVGFVVNDLETGNFIELNDSIIENTGYTKDEFLTFNYWNLFPEEYRWMEPLVIGTLKETGVFGPVQLEYARKDGVRQPIMINGLLTKDENGKEQIWTVVQDITEIKMKEQELRQLNEEIENQNLLLSISNNELEQFAYVASHDLQEPLRMITGFLSLLEAKYKDQLDEKAQEYIHYAVNGAARLRQIIIDLLEYSKISKDNSEAQATDLEETIKTVIQLLSGTIKEKNAQISWNKLPKVLGQRAPLNQLFYNLISNALKYQTPGVPPEINISVTEMPNAWKFTVSDNGIGIDSEFHKKVFVLFNRLHSKSEYEGTGIGLALCKKIVEKHGGEIWVESEVNQGSKICFTLFK